MNKSTGVNYIHILLFILLILIDQLLKQLVLFEKTANRIICNSQLSWGINFKPNNWFIILLVAFFFFLGYISKNSFRKLAYILVAAGGAGNLIDRLTKGCVIDFINVPFMPVFNFADLAVTAGAVLFILNIIKKQKTREIKGFLIIY